MGVFRQGAERLEHFARGQIDGGRKIEAPWQGAERLEHLARGIMIGALCQGADRWGISTGVRKIGALWLCQGPDRWGHFTKGQNDWSTLPGGR